MPLIAIHTTLPDASIGLWRMTDRIEDHDALYAEACGRFSSMSRRREYVCVRLLLRAMAGEDAVIRYEDSGRPRLTDGRNISISHTRGLCTIIISDSCNVGIDIEVISDRAMKIADRFLPECRGVPMWSSDKHGCANTVGAYPCGRPPVVLPSSECAPLLFWCAKETVYKLYPEDRLSFSDMVVVGVIAPTVRVLNKKRNVEVCVRYVILSDAVLTYSIAK